MIQREENSALKPNRADEYTRKIIGMQVIEALPVLRLDDLAGIPIKRMQQILADSRQDEE